MQKGNIKSHMDRKHPEIPYDHTEFQEVKIEKSKYSREAKQENMPGNHGADAFNVNALGEWETLFLLILTFSLPFYKLR